MRVITVSKLQEKNIVSQSNSLVEARYRVTKIEQKLLFAMISLIEPNDKNFLTFSITVDQLSKILNLERRSALREFKKASKRLLKRIIELRVSNGWDMFQWVSKVTLRDNVVSLRFHNDLKPHLLDLKKGGNFTQYKLGMTIQFRSAYAIRIYQLLKEYHSKRIYEFEFSLEEFRKMMLGENLKTHPIFKNFKRHVLNVSQKELSKIDTEKSTKEVTVYKSDLNFQLETRRTGRKISHLKFIIYSQNTTAPLQRIIKQKSNETEETQAEPVAQIILDYEAYGVMRETTQPYLKARGEQALSNTFELFKQHHKDGKIKDSIGGYLAHLLKNNAGQKTESDRIEEYRKKAKIEKETEKAQQEKLKIDFKTERQQAVQQFLKASTKKAKQTYIKQFEASDIFKFKIKQYLAILDVYQTLGMKEPAAQKAYEHFIIVNYLDDSLCRFDAWKQEKGLN